MNTSELWRVDERDALGRLWRVLQNKCPAPSLNQPADERRALDALILAPELPVHRQHGRNEQPLPVRARSIVYRSNDRSDDALEVREREEPWIHVDGR